MYAVLEQTMDFKWHPNLEKQSHKMSKPFPIWPQQLLLTGTTKQEQIYVKQIIYLPLSDIIHAHYVKKVQVGKDQEKAQSEKDSHSKNRGGKKPN